MNNDADVAFTALDKAQTFFQNTDNAQKYKFLCKDDTTSNSESPCVWSKQLRTLIVANRFLFFYLVKSIVYLRNFFFSGVANSVRSILEQWLQNYKLGGMTPFGISGNTLVNQLLSVLQLQGSTDRIRFLGDIDLKTYVAGKQFKSNLIDSI